MRACLFALVGFGLALGTAASQSTGSIRTSGSDFRDEQGRTLILRGVDLGGTSKIPARTSSDPTKVSFVGRPFPISQADEHFRRLESWGLTVERLIVPWEAVEHAGPGIYDKAYLAYLHELVKRANSHGIRVVVDLHQDFYSRATGGDGAPYWTLTKLGLLPDHTNEPGAPQKQPARGPGYWPPTAARFSVDTMDTLFWAGDDFAPGFQVDGLPVQEWLQSHYVNAMRQVALRLRDLPNVVGYDTYNEPQAGFINVRDLRSAEIFMMVIGHYAAPGTQTPSYWDYIQAASGFAPEKPTVPANLLWAAGTKDLWRQFGVWDVVDGRPTLLKPDYFSSVNGKTHSHNYYLAALERRIATAIHEIAPTALIAQEPSAMGGSQKELALELKGAMSEPHFYDAVSMLSKQQEANSTLPIFSDKPVMGKEAVLNMYVKEIETQKKDGRAMGDIPTWFGETGIPYDINAKSAYKTGDFSVQNAFAALMYQALDKTMSSYAIWCYSSDNSNAEGDHWDNEDYSIYSPDQRANPNDINSGGRTLDEVVRPYPLATAGKPVSIDFDSTSKTFRYVFKADRSLTADTEIFIPRYQYPKGVDVSIQGGTFKLDTAKSRLFVSAGSDEVALVVTAKP